MSAVLEKVQMEVNPTRFFVLEGASVLEHSQAYKEAYFAAAEARNDLLERYGADGYQSTESGFEALCFNGQPPKGWIRKAGELKAYQPDYCTPEGIAAGREIHDPSLAYPGTEMVARAMGIKPMMVVGDEVHRPRVEVMDGVHVVTVPRTMLKPGAKIEGAREISQETYVAMREAAFARPEPEPEQRSRARP